MPELEPDDLVLPEELLPPLLAPPDALGEDEPEDLAFVDFLDFFLVDFGLVSVVVSDAPAADAPEVAPVVPLPADEPPVALGELDEPDAPIPLEPEAPDELSPAPEALEPGEPLAPDALEPGLELEPEEPELDDPGVGVLDGTELEVPLPPAMPASLPVPAPVAPVALWDFVVDDGSVALLLPDCASAMDETEATTISDSERRVVLNVMSNSFELEKWHHRCSSLDATPARLFSGFHAVVRQNALRLFQVTVFKDFLTM